MSSSEYFDRRFYGMDLCSNFRVIYKILRKKICIYIRIFLLWLQKFSKKGYCSEKVLSRNKEKNWRVKYFILYSKISSQYTVSTHMRLQVGIRQQSLHDLPEARRQQRQEHTGHCHMISRLRAARGLSAAVHRQLPRDVAHWDLV